MKLGLICDMVRVNPKTGEEHTDTRTFYNNEATVVLPETDLNELYDHMTSDITESLSRRAPIANYWTTFDSRSSSTSFDPGTDQATCHFQSLWWNGSHDQHQDRASTILNS